MATAAPTQTQERAGVRPIAVPPGVAAVAAVGAATAALIKFDLTGRSLVAALFCAVLVVLSAIDLRDRIIPNRIVVPAAAVVLLGNVAAEPQRAKEWTIAAFGTMAGALVVSLATRGGLGMGDVKLAFLLGAGLGWHVFGGLVWAMIAVFVISVAILARRGVAARKDTVPFSPFLAFGAMVELLLS